MNKTPQPPDLLTPVVEAIKKLSGKEKAALAVELDVSVATLRMLGDDTRRLGPSYRLVVALYERLVAKKAA